MTLPAWRLAQHDARLAIAQLAASLNLLRPHEGLADLAVGSDRIEGVRLLGIAVSSFPREQGCPPAECHVRGSELFTVYGRSKAWPVRLDASWRAAASSGSDAPLATLSLLLSVRTEMPESWPELSVEGALPADEVLRLVDPESVRFDPLGRSEPHRVERDSGPAVLLFRLPTLHLSYAEMVHPVDFVEAQVNRCAESDSRVCVRHRLFSSPLEKGVILRARVRAVFVRRQDDARLAAEAYRVFVAEEPPLGT